MQMTEVDFAELVTSVWEGMLGIELERTHLDSLPSPGAHRYISAVAISGCWEGSVVIECSEPLGREAATAMFGSDDVSDEELVDVIGELANMIGGNVKALLPGEASLSLPTVVQGGDFRVVVPGTYLERSLAWQKDGHAVKVSVLSKTGNQVREAT